MSRNRLLTRRDDIGEPLQGIYHHLNWLESGFLCNYSPSLWHGFCPVKRTGKYFAKKWSEQKVLGIEVAGLYSTYQKYKRIDGPSSYQFRENWTWVFFPKKLQKSKLFSPKIRGFLWGQTWTVRTSNHPSNHPWKKLGGCYQEYWVLNWNVQKSHISSSMKMPSI